MNRALRWIPLIVLGCSVASQVGAVEDPLQLLDLERVVEVALERNPGLLAVEERRQEVAGGVQEVRADAYPQLDLVSSWSRSRNPALLNSPDFDDIIEQFPDFQPGEQELWDLGFTIQQPLYSGGKVKAARRLAESVVDIAEVQIQVARLDVALIAAESYYGLLAAQRGLVAVQSQEAARQAAFDVVEARFELGEATRLEWLRARSALVSLGPTIAGARGAVQVAETRLRFAMGLDATAVLEVEVPAPGPSTFAALSDHPGLLSVARRERPELEDLRLQLEALGHQKQIKVAGGRPQVDLNGRYAHQVSEPENFDNTLFADWLAAVSLRWSFYDGGRRKGQVAQLDSQRQQLIWQQREWTHRIASQLAEASTEYETARQRLLAAEISLEVATEASRVALETYQQGVSLQADLIAAQDDEMQAELERIGSYFDGLIKAARLRRALGRQPTEALPSFDDPIDEPVGSKQSFELDRE